MNTRCNTHCNIYVLLYLCIRSCINKGSQMTSAFIKYNSLIELLCKSAGWSDQLIIQSRLPACC